MLNQIRKLKKVSIIPTNILNPSSQLYYLLLFKSGLNIKLV